MYHTSVRLFASGRELRRGWYGPSMKIHTGTQRDIEIGIEGHGAYCYSRRGNRDMENAQARRHVHQSPQRSLEKSSRNNTVAAFAKSTIKAVHCALHKYRLTINKL